MSTNASPRRRSQQPELQQLDHEELSNELESASDGPANVTSSSASYTLSNYERLPEMHVAADFIEKIHSLKFTLETDLIACDAKWTLFVAAALSYRYDSQLRPFPPKFVSEQMGFNINALVSIINDTPKLRVVLQNISDQNYDDFDTEVLDLLHWVLVERREPLLRSVDDEEFNSVLRSLHQHTEQTSTSRPTHIFEVCTPTASPDTEENATEPIGIKLAFHSNKLDSFFSIMQLGFAQSPSTSTGNIELCTDLSTSVERSPNGAGWGASACGSMISCVALCEYGDHPDHIKVSPPTDTGVAHIQVLKAEHVRPRFLLFYGSRFPDDANKKRVVLSWIGRHKYVLSLACYTMLLTSIGIANSGSGNYLKHLLSKKAAHLLDFCKKIFVSD